MILKIFLSEIPINGFRQGEGLPAPKQNAVECFQGGDMEYGFCKAGEKDAIFCHSTVEEENSSLHKGIVGDSTKAVACPSISRLATLLGKTHKNLSFSAFGVRCSM